LDSFCGYSEFTGVGRLLFLDQNFDYADNGEWGKDMKVEEKLKNDAETAIVELPDSAHDNVFIRTAESRQEGSRDRLRLPNDNTQILVAPSECQGYSTWSN